MGSRALIAEITESILALPSRYLPDRAPHRPRRYRLLVGKAPPFTVEVVGPECRVWPGEGARAHAWLRAEPLAWMGMVQGKHAGFDAFLAGDLQVGGDLNEALRLETLFAPPDGSPGARTHARVRRYRIGGGLSVEAYEAGPTDHHPVLLLHGLGASKVSLLPVIAGLAATHRVIAIDLPGFGKSSRPPFAPYDAEWLAAVAEQTLDAAGVGRAAVVGNSLGGRVAVELALRAPSRITAAALLCPSVAFSEYQVLRPLLRASRLDMIVGAAPWLVGSQAAQQLVDVGLRRLFADPSRVPAANLAAAREDFLRSLRNRRSRMALLAATRRIGLEDPQRFWSRLEGLRVPSLWVFAEQDRLVSATYAERVRAHSDGTALVEVWRDCGHVPQFEHPHRTVERLQAFLNEGY